MCLIFKFSVTSLLSPSFTFCLIFFFFFGQNTYLFWKWDFEFISKYNVGNVFECVYQLLEHQHQKILSYSILPSQKVTLLFIPYHFTIPPASQNSIFIKILFFNLSLLFISNCHFFQTRRDCHIFLGFPTASLSPLTSSSGSTHKATHRDP